VPRGHKTRAAHPALLFNKYKTEPSDLSTFRQAQDFRANGIVCFPGFPLPGPGYI